PLPKGNRRAAKPRPGRREPRPAPSRSLKTTSPQRRILARPQTVRATLVTEPQVRPEAAFLQAQAIRAPSRTTLMRATDPGRGPCSPRSPANTKTRATKAGIRFLRLLVACALRASCPVDAAPPPDVPRITEGFVLGPIPPGGRFPVHVDPVEHAIVTGRWT